MQLGGESGCGARCARGGGVCQRGQRDTPGGFTARRAKLALQLRGQAMQRAGAHVMRRSWRVWSGGCRGATLGGHA